MAGRRQRLGHDALAQSGGASVARRVGGDGNDRYNIER